MSLTIKDIRSLYCACILLVLALVAPGLKAQVDYFEMIGSSDVELMAYLGNLNKDQEVIKDRDRVEVKGKDITVIFNLRRGKVISLKFRQFFPTSQKAVEAYNRSMSYLYGRGVPLRQIRNLDTCRVVRGYGGGVEANLTVMPVKDKYRMDADLILIN